MGRKKFKIEYIEDNKDRVVSSPPTNLFDF